MSITPTFLYHAQGMAIGGVMRRPFNEVIESTAATSLAQTGGFGTAVKEDFNYRDIFRFKRASTQVSGSKGPDGSYNTLVTTTIEGLNVNNVLTCARIVARLTTIHTPNDDETRVIPSGSEFVDLRIGGHPVDPELDLPTFCELDSMKSIREKFSKDAGFRQAAAKRFRWDRLKGFKPDTLPESKGMLSCSLVKKINCDCPELTIDENKVVVPDFGTIYLGEYWVKESSRKLTMVRMALGSPVEGDVTVGGIEGNGTHYP